MSVVHETLKRIREKQLQKSTLSPQDAAQFVDKKRAPWRAFRVIWALSFFLIVATSMLLREIYVHHKVERKLKLALLTLNDTRGDTLETQKIKSKLEAQVEDLKERLNKSYRDHNRLSEEKRLVEMENLQKEKKISELTKKAHQAELKKFEIEDELISLKRELVGSISNSSSSTAQKS